MNLALDFLISPPLNNFKEYYKFLNKNLGFNCIDDGSIEAYPFIVICIVENNIINKRFIYLKDFPIDSIYEFVENNPRFCAGCALCGM